MKEKYIRDNSISIKKFLKIYMGINDSEILDSKISHKDLKYINPNFKRLPYDYVLKEKKKILSGDIIIVVDDYGNYVPYDAPKAQFNIDIIDSYQDFKRNDKLELEELIVEEELEKLNKWELNEVCKKYKEKNRNREYRIAYRILRKKKEKDHKTDKFMKGKGKI